MKRRLVVQHRTEVSYKAKAVHALARLFVWPVLATLPISPLSTPLFGLVETAAARRRPPSWADLEPVEFDGFRGEWVRADNATNRGVVLYFHGGAFLFGGLATHRPVVASISRAAQLPVFSVGYRHLPKVPLAGSIADCLTSYRWLLSEGMAPDRIVLAGDSAGGYLAFATALRAIDEGLPRPGGIVAVSPWLDLDCETKLSHPNSRRDAYAPAQRLPRLVQMLTEGVVPVDPMLSPVNHDLSGLPPSLLIVAESEMLRCDSELMAERLAAAGVPCTLQIWEGQVHAFPTMVGVVPEAGRAIREIGSFVRRHTGIRATRPRRKAS